MPKLDPLVDITPGEEPLTRGPALTPDVEFERHSPSWTLDGAVAAGSDAMHIETVDAIRALFIGRRTRNLLAPEFAPFSDVPESWCQLGGVSLASAGLSFGKGSLRVDAAGAVISLPFPPVVVHPEDEVRLPGTAQLGVVYQLSAFLRGSGRAILRIRDERNNLECEKVVSLTSDWQRPCVALDGPFDERVLSASIVIEGGTAFVDGLLLEPYVVTHRSVQRALLVPAPGGWIPGGQRRDRDRLVLGVREGAIPPSGLIDFWFRPTWSALHVHHTFFQLCHWYFCFELRAAGPEFYAGQKACPWMYYWEWGLAQGYRADTWRHYALAWREDGSATIYLDGQSRAHVEQARPRRFDPALAGTRLAIGGALDDTMSLDPNVPGQMDAYLARWRLQAGSPTPDDALVAMESSDPRPRHRCVPDRAVFLVQQERSLIDRAKEHCWFAHNLHWDGGTLYSSVARGDDTSPSPNRRQNRSTRPSLMESHDRGKTWRPSSALFGREGSRLADGSRVSSPFIIHGDPPSCEMQIEKPGQPDRAFTAAFDMTALPDWPPGSWLAATQLLPCRDGTFLLFCYTSYPGEKGTSVIVLRSEDLAQWRAIARPYRPDGLTETGPNETAAVQFPDGRILVLMRTGGWNQLLARGTSEDGGRTWSPMRPSGLCGIQPRLRLTRDGVLFLVTGRPGIVLAASSDGGETFETCACAEDDRIHEFNAEFGWYGYSCMNNGLAVDEDADEAFISYDLLDERLPGDGTSYNACYVRSHSVRRFADYRSRVTVLLAPDDAHIEREGRWETVPGVMAVTSETGASLSRTFSGAGLVGVIETCPQAGRAVVEIDGGVLRTIPLYFPHRRVQRLLLADRLAPGEHRFRIGLETGLDRRHKFANPEMPMLIGMQTVYLAGVDATRRLAVYGLEVLRV